MLYFKLLGGFQLQIDGKPFPITGPRQRSILAYLILHYPLPVARLSLAMHLWPESNNEQALASLRGHLLKLRKSQPQLYPYLAWDKSEIYWLPETEISSDVIKFRQHLKSAAQSNDESLIHFILEQAVDLYEGGLFPDCYDEWIVEEREVLHDRFIHVLEQLSVLHESFRDYKEAILYSRRLLRFEPQREEGYRHLMRLHALLGELDEVERTYRRCERIFREEFSALPSKSMIELYDQLKQSRQIEFSAVAPRVPLIGRHAEWEQLQKCWRKALSQGSHSVLLEGAVGIGKSRLIAEMVDNVQRHGFNVFSTTCAYLEQQASYTPVIRWLHDDRMRASVRKLDRNRQAEVAKLLPELITDSTVNAHPDVAIQGLQQTRLHEALAHLFLAQQSPLLLVIDNLQWCDIDTLTWIYALLMHDRRSPLMLLGACCSAYPTQTQLAGWRATLRQHGLLSEIRLAPFSLGESHALAKAATNDNIADDEAILLHRLSKGNPLHILDLLSQQMKLSPTYAERLDHELHTVSDLLLAQLPTHALELAEYIALLGAPASFIQLRRTSRLTEEQLLRSLSLLIDVCLLCEGDGETYQFTNQLLPQLLLQRMNATKRHYLMLRLSLQNEV